MSFLTDLARGFGQLINDAGIGVTYAASGQYTPGQTGISLMTVPATLARSVTLTPYGLGDDPSTRMSLVGLQVRSRGAQDSASDVLALDDAIADVLLGNYPITLSTGIHVQTLVRLSSASMGMDDSRRWEYQSSYRMDVYRPSTHRT